MIQALFVITPLTFAVVPDGSPVDNSFSKMFQEENRHNTNRATHPRSHTESHGVLVYMVASPPRSSHKAHAHRYAYKRPTTLKMNSVILNSENLVWGNPFTHSLVAPVYTFDCIV